MNPNPIKHIFKPINMNKRITFRPTVNDDICSFEFSIDGKVAGCIYNEANDVSKGKVQEYIDILSRSVDMHDKLMDIVNDYKNRLEDLQKVNPTEAKEMELNRIVNFIRLEEPLRTSRVIAMEWWNNLSSLTKTRLCDINTEIVGKVRRHESLTGREIEEIYKKENKK